MTAPAPGLAAVQARIAGIQSRFPVPVQRSATVQGADFEAAMRRVSTSPSTTSATGALPSTTTAVSGTTDGAAVIASAKKYLGVPYVWGGTDPAKGLDCSGFVQRAYRDLGIELPRVSRDQARAGTPVPDLASARPGDLVAFGSPVDHIGIYMGDNQMIVAPRRGDVVKVQELYRTPTAIRRILPDTGVQPGTAAAPSGAGAYAALFAQAEQRTGVPATLLSAVARAESGYDPTAVSPAGAQGLMQIMPGTARELGVDALDPAQAVDGASRLLAEHLRDFGTTELALAAYNAGPGAVRRYDGVPPFTETQTYVQRVMSYAGLRP